jgi:transposase-like protein
MPHLPDELSCGWDSNPAMKNQAQNQDRATRIRRQHCAERKVRLQRRHLVEGQAISTICDTHQIHPNLFYQWQKTFFENGARLSTGRPAPGKLMWALPKLNTLRPGSGKRMKSSLR